MGVGVGGGVLSSLLFPYDFGLVKECTLCIPKYKL